MNRRQAKKQRTRLAQSQKAPRPSFKERKAEQRGKVLLALRDTPMYEGRLKDNADYYAAIKMYKEYVNKGYIKEEGSLSKYEAADKFMTTLSKKEELQFIMEANEKAAKMEADSRARAATMTPEAITARYGF